MGIESILELHRSGDLAAAEAAYREYLQAQPQDADALHLLGVLRQQQGTMPWKQARADRARDRDRAGAGAVPSFARRRAAASARGSGGACEFRARARARSEFDRGAKPSRPSAIARWRCGRLTEQRFKIGRRAGEEDPLILFGLGNVHLARHDAANATKFLTRAAELKPDSAAIQASLGRALFDQGAFAFAEKALENALRLRPDMSIAKLYLARSRLRQDNNDAARDLFNELLAGNQQAFGAMAGLGDVARKKGQTLKALKFYRRALALDPAHPGVINACAWGMESLGDLAGAARYLAEGLQRAPQAHELRTPLAALLDRLGRSDEAAQVRQAGGAGNG